MPNPPQTTSVGIRVLILAYGNPLRGDDAAGWWVGEHIEQAVQGTAGAEIVIAHQLMPEMSELASRAEEVWFVDADASLAPGQTAERAVTATANDVTVMTHHVDPPGILALARTLYGRSPDAKLIGIGGEDFGHKEGLTPAVERACAEVVERLVNRVRERCTNCP